MIPALIAAFALMTATASDQSGGGEPLPPGAPTDPYELSAWCYGALNEYLLIYDKVKPDLRAIDNEFGGDKVVESEPYASDMAAAHAELKMIGEAVTAAEQASPSPIADEGADAMREGQSIWSIAESRPERELARAWMMWALPDRCDSNARELAARSLLLGKALKYNASQHAAAPHAPSATALSAAATALPQAAPPAPAPADDAAAGSSTTPTAVVPQSDSTMGDTAVPTDPSAPEAPPPTPADPAAGAPQSDAQPPPATSAGAQ